MRSKKTNIKDVIVLFTMKIHQHEGKRFLSACDIDLIGKTFEEDEHLLDIPESFFKGDKETIESIISSIELCDSSHLIGNNLIEKLLENNIVDEQNLKEVDGNRHVMIFRV